MATGLPRRSAPSPIVGRRPAGSTGPATPFVDLPAPPDDNDAAGIDREGTGDVRYLCLIYNSKENTEAEQSGAPEPGQDAVTIRVRNGRLSAVEGSGGRGSERPRRVLLIRARDLNDAIRIASQMPEAQFGSIEIRPVDDPE